MKEKEYLRKNQVAVLDVGSSKIKAVIGERGVNKTFVIKSSADIEYSGFSGGIFIDIEQTKNAVSDALNTVMNNCGAAIDTLYVGVPGEWCTVAVREHQISFPKKRKITEEILSDIYNSAYNIKSFQYKLINRAAAYFVLDDNRRVAQAIGQFTESLKGVFSFVLCDVYFTDLLDSVCKLHGITNVEYISTSLAEATYLFTPELRDRIAVLLDCGWTTSSLSVIQGDGLLYQKSFGFGGGYITALLAEKFNIDMAIAERLKRKVNLSCEYGEDDTYRIIDGNKEYEYPATAVNQAVLRSLDDLCESIDLCLIDSGICFADYVPLSLTGGGVSYMRGIREEITKRINMNVEIISPNTPYLNKPIHSSYLSLLDVALSQVPKEEKFFKKLFK